ncbi:hypothetical protein [Alkalinema sp. FACHB-956]|uniref:hypothetical protein n=1 Tax=Alkalinema sp. FACHB-956 TaxID=2692768 RepID=UPI001683C9A1|nr:hypothetical protein [Alkalinema sp. FACHB-956]MBD2325308.1 hypothetical protein [Alkalinema sp. FACHB-956]
MGLEVRQDYRVINLWEVDAAIVFEQSLNALLLLVPVLKNGGETPVVQRALNQLRGDSCIQNIASIRI